MTLRYVEAPAGIDGTLPRPFVFLAGGITNCPNWQLKFHGILSKKIEETVTNDFTIFNPRRDNFPIHDPNASQEQIQWEHNALRLSDIILFWFSRGSDNPIVFYEYGTWLTRNYHFSRPMVLVGCDPEFKRQSDVSIQSKLLLPMITVHKSLESMADSLLGNYVFIWHREDE